MFKVEERLLPIIVALVLATLTLSVETRRPPRNYGQILPAEKPKFPMFGGEDNEAQSLTANEFAWQSKLNSNGHDLSKSNWKEKDLQLQILIFVIFTSFWFLLI